MKQPFSEEGAPRRAFSLKMSYMRTILQYVTDSGKRRFPISSFLPDKLFQKGNLTNIILKKSY